MSPVRAAVSTALAFLCGAASPARAQSCAPHWAPGAIRGDLVGGARTLLVRQEAGEPVLYAGGTLLSLVPGTSVPAAGVERWTASTGWRPLGAPIVGDRVYSLAFFDDGSGEALYAGGQFISIGGVAASNVAKWSGTSWSPLGSGANGTVRALAVFDDGSGPALYVGGIFTAAGGQPSLGLTKWTSQGWTPVGVTGPGGSQGLGVYALLALDPDGAAGPQPVTLFAGGGFAGIAGVPAMSIAQRTGLGWQPLEPGGIGESPVGPAPGAVLCLGMYDAADGPCLVVGGQFRGAGGLLVANVARWRLTSESWATLGSGIPGGNIGSPFINALQPFGMAGQTFLYAGGNFEVGQSPSLGAYLARFDGSSWLPLPGDLASGGYNSGPVRALAVLDDGRGPRLCLGSETQTTLITGLTQTSVARWDGSTLLPVGDAPAGLITTGGLVNTAAVYDDGHGSAVYAGGGFTSLGGTAARGLARWDGAQWQAVGGGLVRGASPGTARAVQVIDDGTGPELWVAGLFTSVDGASASNVATWNGVRWRAIGAITTTVDALANIMTGPAAGVYAVSGATVYRLDAGTWAPIGSFSYAGGAGSLGARSLVVLDNGGGPALYACGHFDQVSGVPAPNIARWTGIEWDCPGGGLSPTDFGVAMAVHDDGRGGGPALYAVGRFALAGAAPAAGFARWNGASWTALGSVTQGPVVPTALASLDDGTGPALYAIGGTMTLDGVAATGVARWRGGAWWAVGGGLDRGPVSLCSLAAPRGPELWVSGLFTMAGGQPSAGLARWVGIACPPDTDCNGAVEPADISLFVNRWFTSLQQGTLEGDFDASGAVEPADVSLFVGRWFQALAAGQC